MATSDIITGQFVRISQTPAGIGERIAARAIDMGMMILYVISFSLLISYSNLYDLPFWSYLNILFSLPICFYSFLFETFNHGQTIGKYIMKLRVVNIDGSRPTMGSLILRWMFLIIDVYFNFIGLLFIACSKKNQRLGGLASGTMVIKTAEYKKMRISLDEFYYARRYYQPKYPEAKQLSFGQAEVIKSTIYSRSKQKYMQIDALADKVKTFLNIQNIKTNNADFLQSLYYDYQYYMLELV